RSPTSSRSGRDARRASRTAARGGGRSRSRRTSWSSGSSSRGASPARGHSRCPSCSTARCSSRWPCSRRGCTRSPRSVVRSSCSPTGSSRSTPSRDGTSCPGTASRSCRRISSPSGSSWQGSSGHIDLPAGHAAPDSCGVSRLPPIAVRAAAPEVLPLPAVEGLRWRPLERGDVPAWTALVQAGQEADGLEFRLSQEEAAEAFDMPAVTMETDSLLGLDAEGVPRAWALVYRYEGDETLVRAVVDGGVHPAWRARGVGTQLVAWGTARGRQLL